MLEHGDNRPENQTDSVFDGYIKGLEEVNERLVDASIEELPALKEAMERHIRGLEEVIEEQEKWVEIREE